MSYASERKARITALVSEVGRHKTSREYEDFSERLVRECLWNARRVRWRFWSREARDCLRAAKDMRRSWHFDRALRRCDDARVRGDFNGAHAILDRAAARLRSA